jgi:hypothetical protein
MCRDILCAGTFCVQGHSVAGDPPFWDGDQGGPEESQLASTLGFGSGLYCYLLYVVLFIFEKSLELNCYKSR